MKLLHKKICIECKYYKPLHEVELSYCKMGGKKHVVCKHDARLIDYFMPKKRGEK